MIFNKQKQYHNVRQILQVSIAYDNRITAIVTVEWLNNHSIKWKSETFWVSVGDST